MYLLQNLRLLRSRIKLSQQVIADAIGIHRTTLCNYEHEIAFPSFDTLLRFADYYKISIDHLLRTDLSKLKETELSDLLSSDISGKNLRVLATTVNSKNEENIELVSLKARAGYPSGYADPEFIAELPSGQIPFLGKSKKYRFFQIDGDSMPPAPTNSWVIGEYIQDWRSIESAKPYIVVTRDEGVVFKIAYNYLKEEKNLLLCSTNPVYPPFRVGADQVLEVWKFIYLVTPELTR